MDKVIQETIAEQMFLAAWVREHGNIPTRELNPVAFAVFKVARSFFELGVATSVNNSNGGTNGPTEN